MYLPTWSALGVTYLLGTTTTTTWPVWRPPPNYLNTRQLGEGRGNVRVGGFNLDLHSSHMLCQFFQNSQSLPHSIISSPNHLNTSLTIAAPLGHSLPMPLSSRLIPSVVPMTIRLSCIPKSPPLLPSPPSPNPPSTSDRRPPCPQTRTTWLRPGLLVRGSAFREPAQTSLNSKKNTYPNGDEEIR